jgi:hypothetical protein
VHGHQGTQLTPTPTPTESVDVTTPFLSPSVFPFRHRSGDDYTVGCSLQTDVTKLREVLCAKLSEISSSLEGDFPLVREHVWLGAQECEARPLLPQDVW